jgi:hypothetical protein
MVEEVSMLVGRNETIDVVLTNVLHVPRFPKKPFLCNNWVTFLNLERKGVSS